MTEETDIRFKTRLIRIWAWLLAHPTVLWAGAAFIAGATLPRLVWWLL